MSGGITDPPKAKRKPFYEGIAQGSTAGELIKQLKEFPEDAPVMWVDSYTEENFSFNDPTVRVTAAIGFKWPAVLPEP